MRTVSLMGSTGSVGTQALDVIRGEPERFRVHALAARSSAEALVLQAAEFRPDLVVIGDGARAGDVRAGVPAGTEVRGQAELTLSVRELEIARMIADDFGDKEIAWRLGVEVSTVRTHLKRIFAKLGVRRRSGVASLLARRR